MDGDDVGKGEHEHDVMAAGWGMDNALTARDMLTIFFQLFPYFFMSIEEGR